MDRIIRFVGRVKAWSTSRRVQRILLVVSLVAFVALAAGSYIALPDDLEINWWFAPVLILVTTPLTVLANAAEFRVMADVSHRGVGWLFSSRLALIASAANLLPLPGGVVVRTQALKSNGTSYRRALGANVLAGAMWAGVGAFGTGVLLATAGGDALIGVALIGAGVIPMVGVTYLIRRLRPEAWVGLSLRLVVVEIVTIVLMALRMYFAFLLLGSSLNVVQAAALTMPAIVAAAVGIFPSGLGLREAFSGLVAVMVDLPVAITVAATAVDRVFAQIGLAVMAGALLLVGGRDALRADGRRGEREEEAGTLVEVGERVPGQTVVSTIEEVRAGEAVEPPHHGL